MAVGRTKAIRPPKITAKPPKTIVMLNPRDIRWRSSQRTSGSSASAMNNATPIETMTVDSEDTALASVNAINAPTVAVKPQASG